MNLTSNNPANKPTGSALGAVWFVRQRTRVPVIGPPAPGIGPVSQSQIQDAIKQGVLSPEDFVWTAQYPQWTKIKQVQQLGYGPQLLSGDSLPLAILFSLVVCLSAYFGLNRSPTQLAAKTTISLPTPQTFKANEQFDLKVCNHSDSERLYVSVAYFDHKVKDWVSRGWYPQMLGSCKVILKNLSAPIYGFAETMSGESRWKGDGESAFCIDGDKAFVNHQKDCRKNINGSRVQSFQRLDSNPNDGRLTWEIR